MSQKVSEIYPVPNDGMFTATINAPVEDDYTIYVIGDLGQRIFELKGRMEQGRNERKIDLRPISPGDYMVILRKGDGKIVRRIIISR